MKDRLGLVAASLLCLAGAAHAAGDAERGELLSDTCHGCHNAGGIRNPPPTIYRVPKLKGQNADYIVAALTAYKNGERAHKGMRALATPLSGQDMQDIAAYWSGLEWQPTSGRAEGDAGAGEQKAAACAGCHGAGGTQPIMPAYPKLAGQHADYIHQVLTDYKDGDRKNPIMAGQVMALSEEDMQDLAAYFASQQPK